MSEGLLTKDPAEKANFSIDYADWLEGIGSGITISASSWTVPAGITQDTATFTTTRATIRLSGGTDGTDYELVNHITLSDGQEEERAITIQVRAVEGSGISWSYDPTKLTTGLNKVRFLIGDTIASDPLIESDAEINFCLSEKGNNIYLAGAFACRRAAAKIVRELTLSGDIASLDRNQQYRAFMELAVQLESEAASHSTTAVYAGGISVADMDSRALNTDRPKRAFTTETFTDDNQLLSNWPS